MNSRPDRDQGHQSDSVGVRLFDAGAGAVEWLRTDYDDEWPYESCAVCHGEGRSADVAEAHGL